MDTDIYDSPVPYLIVRTYDTYYIPGTYQT